MISKDKAKVLELLELRLLTKPTYGDDVFIAKNATVIGNAVIDDDSSIWYGVVIRSDVNDIKIGKRTNIQDGSVIHVSSKDYYTQIGDDVTVGHMVMLHGCIIKNNCLIGNGAIILDGAIIGENSIVAAGTLIPPRKVFPPNSFIMGYPGKVTREITEDDLEMLKESSARYVRYKNIYLARGVE